MQYLRQSTAGQGRTTPPFLDSSDFLTPATGLTINAADVKLIKNGGASVEKNAGGGTHRANGQYSLTFDDVDTAETGELKVSIVKSGATPVFMSFWVLEEAVYDALFGAAATGYAAVAELTLVKAKTDNLPDDPADQSLIVAATDAIMTRLGVPAGASLAADVAAVDALADAIVADTGTDIPALIAALDVLIDAIKAKTDAVVIENNAVAANLVRVKGSALGAAKPFDTV